MSVLLVGLGLTAVIVVVLDVVWTAAAGAGWWVVFSAADGAVVDAASGGARAPASQLAALLVDEGWAPEAWQRRRQRIRAGVEPPTA